MALAMMLLVTGAVASDTRNCAEDLDGGGWTLVRHSYNKWPDADDNLVGTAEYGTVSGPTSDNEFAIAFDAANDTQFLFSNGDCDRWLITTFDQFGYPWGSNYDANILKSCISDTPYTAKWHNRAGVPEDPWISYEDHSAGGKSTIIYGENDHQGANIKNAYGQFVNVWMREDSISSTAYTLKPGGDDVDDIDITLGAATVTHADHWYLDEDSYPNEWAIQMDLSGDLQFTSSVSSISVEIDGSKVSNEGDMFFGIGDGTKYISYLFDFDGGLWGPNKVDRAIWSYPQCGGSLGDGDIASILLNAADFDSDPWWCPRDALAGGDRLNWGQFSSAFNGDTWPVTLTITNDVAADEVTFTHSSSSLEASCTFSGAFAVDSDVTVGILPDIGSGTDDDFKITSITVAKSTAASGSVSPCDYESDGDISVQFGGAAKVSASPQCEWYLGTDAKMVDDWALGLKLSRDYQFGDGISSVSVEFEGECVTSECDMFWGFGDGQKWLTVFHDFESDGGANAKADGVQNGFWVYPPCGGPLADGDIESVLAGSTSSGDYPWNVVRDQLAAGDRTDWHYLSSNLNGDTWPVTVEVTNFVGGGASTFHFLSDSLNEECHFTEAFLGGTDLFVAIQPDLQNGTHDDIRVHSLSVEKNVIPTSFPTRAPTDSPTGAPSESPSPAPTDAPTSAPSSAPSESPTPAPTDAPSPGPTSAPTDAPSSAPSESPTPAPSYSPTNSPTSVCEGYVDHCRDEYATICDTYFSAPSITSFGIIVGATDYANTAGTVSVSLWNGGKLYQCSFDGMSRGATYSCSSATWWQSGTACDSSSADYKLLVENPDKDAVDIDYVFLTVDGQEYSYDAWCTSDEWKPFNHDIEYSPSSCPGGYVNYDKICLDTDQCDTTTAMFHFELTNPGQTAYDALMEDAADICVVPNGCDCPLGYASQQIASNPVIPRMNVRALDDTGSWSVELSVRDLLFAMSVFVNVLFVAICFFKRMAGGSGKYQIVRFDSETELEAL